MYIYIYTYRFSHWFRNPNRCKIHACRKPAARPTGGTAGAGDVVLYHVWSEMAIDKVVNRQSEIFPIVSALLRITP